METQVLNGEPLAPERKLWVTPLVNRMEAGSAELGTNDANPDGDGTFS